MQATNLFSYYGDLCMRCAYHPPTHSRKTFLISVRESGTHNIAAS